MHTFIIDPNRVDFEGRVVVHDSDVTNLFIGDTVRMLEVDTGEYWYGILKDIKRWSEFRSQFYIRPLHQPSYGGWIDYEQDAQD